MTDNCSLPEDGHDADMPIEGDTNALVAEVQPDGLPCWRDGEFISTDCGNCGFHTD